MARRTIGMEFNINQLSLPFGARLVFSNQRVKWLNLALGLASVGLLVFYILLSNDHLALKYQEDQLRQQLKALSTTQSELAAKYQAAAGLNALFTYARAIGLVEQATVEFISGQNNLAQNSQ